MLWKNLPEGSEIPPDKDPLQPGERMPEKKQQLIFWSALLLIESGLVIYSQSVAYFGNESFHLLAAKLINAGRRPYADFFYQHAPLYACLNALWMRAFGETWRSAHLLSALLTGGCVALLADYIYSRFNTSPQRVTIALFTAALLGLNFYVIAYGTIGMPFAISLFSMAAAFRLTIAAVEQTNYRLAGFAGACIGAAAASSLITAPAVIVLLLWLMRYNLAGKRLIKCAAFLAGAAIALLPLLWLFVEAPRQTFFNLVTYHLFYRLETTNDPLRWNLRELFEWFATYQGLLLMPLAFAGFWWVIKTVEIDRRRKAEFHLCGWLVVVLGVLLALPRPTFAFYFVLLTPFVSILASAGVYAIGRHFQLISLKKLIVGLLVLYVIGLAGRSYQSRFEIFYNNHRVVEEAASVINRVTAANGLIYASEQVYFEAGRMPPAGLENGFDPFSKKDEWLAEGRFDTVCTVANDPRIQTYDLVNRYANHQVIPAPHFNLIIFWDKRASG
jgi:hypothetical protein